MKEEKMNDQLVLKHSEFGEEEKKSLEQGMYLEKMQEEPAFQSKIMSAIRKQEKEEKEENLIKLEAAINGDKSGDLETINCIKVRGAGNEKKERKKDNKTVHNIGDRRAGSKDI